MDFINDWSLTVLSVLLHWVLQSSLLILIGLLAARLLRKRGAAIQSAIYRTTLIAALICPLATWGLSQTEFSGWAFRFPDAEINELVTQLQPKPVVVSETIPSDALIEPPTKPSEAQTETALDPLDSQTEAALNPVVTTVPNQPTPMPEVDRTAKLSQRTQSQQTIEKESLVPSHPVQEPGLQQDRTDESKWQEFAELQKEIEALKMITNDYQLTIEITRQ